ncbi:uncharacterized protein BDZ83DRAFT_651071 [Colletotrichum acutatum]|uniref:Uncharacterized protein n=1 Tax=Glomerella acutata TaxID=27357 RepID=A0AAD8ULP3_GLOAC|nr:uncharacterized protein BDZ83DRAFT_651071 [Colletotrichum acutatum]KAK1725643.1 hypothetical protein BDZ83DRAFT_651071 [Colletotrichum acutatum]
MCCGDDEKGDRCFFRVSSLKFHGGDLIVTASGTPSHPDDIIPIGETEWGRWIPRGHHPQPSTASEPTFTWGSAPVATSGSAIPDAGSASFEGSGPPSTTRSPSIVLVTAGLPGTPGNPLSNSSSAGNSSSLQASRNCDAPVDTKYGLPTACLGEYFGEDLDDDLGYNDLSAESIRFVQKIAPQFIQESILEDFKYAIDPEDTFWKQRWHLHGRSFWSFLDVIACAQITYKEEFYNDLINVDLPGLSYGVVTIGPRINVESRVEVEAAAKGKLLVGAEMGHQGNGNLYADLTGGPDNELCSELWAHQNDALIYDGAQRLMHYYGTTMAKLGVSRLRVEAELHGPTDSVVVAWASYYGGPGPEEYYFVAVDPLGEVFYPAVCDYVDGQSPKLFLVRDPVEGIETLESPDLMYTVTGGRVSDCFALVLMQGAHEAKSYLNLSNSLNSRG